MPDIQQLCDDADRLKVRIHQSDEGRKKKIKVTNDFMKVTIKVKDRKGFDLDDFEDDADRTFSRQADNRG